MLPSAARDRALLYVHDRAFVPLCGLGPGRLLLSLWVTPTLNCVLGFNFTTDFILIFQILHFPLL